MKVIITGASGFVGQHLTSYFRKIETSVVPLSLREKDWKKAFPLEADAIIHLAGKAHDTSNTSDDCEYYKVNTDLTITLFDAFLESDISGFVYFSSVKAVADSVEGLLTEDEEAMPLTPYGKSKLKAEEYLLSQALPSNKRLFIFRPCMIHGPSNKGNLNLLYKIVRKGLPWPLGAFDNKRSYCSIENVCFITNEVLMNKNIASGIYNLADDEAISTNVLIQLIAASHDKKARIIDVPVGLIKSVCKVGDVFKLPLNSERLKKLTESYVVDNTKIKNAISSPLPVTTREGLLKTLKSFDNNVE